MTDNYRPIKDLVWQDVGYIQTVNHGSREKHEYRYHIDLFEPLADWDVWDYWEKERIASMQEHIKQGDVLFEVGAEHGWMAGIYSKYMTDRLVLIEPTGEFWPNIKAIFDRNGLNAPLFSWVGFVSDESTDDSNVLDQAGWPEEAFGEEIIEKLKYRNLHDSGDTQQVKDCRIDQIVDKTGIVPDFVSIDVEGAELKVLRGAEKTLKKYKPTLWVSVHPDLLLNNYNTKHEEVLGYLDDVGYKTELLALDHEHHVLCTPKVARSKK